MGQLTTAQRVLARLGETLQPADFEVARRIVAEIIIAIQEDDADEKAAKKAQRAS